jgi:hypothetical protein
MAEASTMNESLNRRAAKETEFVAEAEVISDAQLWPSDWFMVSASQAGP